MSEVHGIINDGIYNVLDEDAEDLVYKPMKINIIGGEGRYNAGSTMPLNYLLNKYEATDDNYSTDNYRNYVRDEIIDKNDNDNWTEGDMNIRSPNQSQNILDSRYKGTRGNIPSHPDLWIAHHDYDNRGASLDPLLKDFRQAMQTRKSGLEVAMGYNADHDVDQGVWHPNSEIQMRQDINKRYKQNAKVFSQAYEVNNNFIKNSSVMSTTKINSINDFKSDTIINKIKNNNQSQSQLKTNLGKVEGLDIHSYSGNVSKKNFIGNISNTTHKSYQEQIFNTELINKAKRSIYENMKKITNSNPKEYEQEFSTSNENSHKKQILKKLESIQYVGQVEDMADSTNNMNKKHNYKKQLAKRTALNTPSIVDQLNIENIKQFKSPLQFSTTKINGKVEILTDSANNANNKKIGKQNTSSKMKEGINELNEDSHKNKDAKKLKNQTDQSKIRKAINTELIQSDSSNLQFQSYKNVAPKQYNGKTKTVQDESVWKEEQNTIARNAIIPEFVSHKNRADIDKDFVKKSDKFDIEGTLESNNKTAGGFGKSKGKLDNRSSNIISAEFDNNDKFIN